MRKMITYNFNPIQWFEGHLTQSKYVDKPIMFSLQLNKERRKIDGITYDMFGKATIKGYCGRRSITFIKQYTEGINLQSDGFMYRGQFNKWGVVSGIWFQMSYPSNNGEFVINLNNKKMTQLSQNSKCSICGGTNLGYTGMLDSDELWLTCNDCNRELNVNKLTMEQLLIKHNKEVKQCIKCNKFIIKGKVCPCEQVIS